MTVPAAKTGTPAGSATPAPAPAPTAHNTDTYGDRTISLKDIPIVGYQNKGTFTPAKKEGEEPPPEHEANEQEGEDKPPEAEGQPEGDGQAKPENVTVIKAKNGKVFKDLTELLNTYDESSPEAVRLANDNKVKSLAMLDMENKNKEANATILAMQEYIGNAAYTPNVPEKYKGMPEAEMIAAMTDDEKLDYRLDKREWSKKVESFKAQMANAKTESEAIAAKIKGEMEQTEAAMSKDTAQYPGFTELAPLRAEIIKQSPHLDNRPDTHYVAYYMAEGILSLKAKAEAARLEVESRGNAANQANAAAANGGGGAPQAPGKSPAPKDDGLRGLVKAGKTIKGTF